MTNLGLRHLLNFSSTFHFVWLIGLLPIWTYFENPDLNKRNTNFISSNASAIEGSACIDAVGDGLQTIQESFISSIPVELHDISRNTYAITESDINGYYHFENENILEGHPSFTSLDTCFSLDCSKSGSNIYFGFHNDCGDQGPWNQYPNCETSAQHIPICDLRILDQRCKTMLPDISPIAVPNPLCPGGGAVHNISWITFIAGFGQYEISINPSNCTTGEGGLSGIQAGVYTDCSFSDAVFCQPECSDVNITIPSSNLIPGQKYYLFIDGCSVSICDNEYKISGDYTPYVFPDSGVLSLKTIQDTFCPNEMVTFTLQGLDLTLDYTWSVSHNHDTISEIHFPDGWPKTQTNKLSLSFPKTGKYTVCMDQVTNTCDYRGPYCKDVVIANRFTFNLLFTDTIVMSGDSITTLINVPEDTSGIIFVVPIPNTFVMNMTADTLFNGGGLLTQQLFNPSEVSQVARFLLFKDSINLPECTYPDTLSITILPSKPILETDIRVCMDSCVTLLANVPDSISPINHYFWSTGDTTNEITACTDKDLFIYVFVQDTQNLFYKIQYHVLPEDVSIDFQIQKQPECQDTVIEFAFQAYSQNFPSEDFLYLIFDCSQPSPALVFSADTAGMAMIQYNADKDSLCYRIDVFSSFCEYSTYLSFPNPKDIIGMPCDDNNELTNNDVYQENCECKGEIIDDVALIEDKDEINIYPNPSTGIVNISNINSLSSFQFYNTMGVEIFPKINISNAEIQADFSEFPSGVYLFIQGNATSKSAHKIVKL